MGLCGLGHGKPALAAEPQGTGGEERHGLIKCFGCPVRRRCRERNAEVGCVLIGEGQNPGPICDEGDVLLEGTLAGRVEHCVDRRAEPRTRSAKPAP